jgi:hypothetical protein
MKQLNTASSLVVIDREGAEKLLPREAIIQVSGQYYKIKTPEIDEERFVYQWLRNKIDRNHKYFDIDAYNKARADAKKQKQNDSKTIPFPDKEVAATTQSKSKGKGKVGINGIPDFD